MKTAFFLLLLSIALTSCSDSPVASEPAAHHEVIYTQRMLDGRTGIMRAMSDGSNRKVVSSEGSLIAAPVRGRILFVEENGQTLHAGNIDGSAATLIDRGNLQGSTLQSAVIAPDAEQFLSVDWDLRNGTTRLSIQNMDGSNNRLFTGNLLPQSKVSFSPDGSRIAYFGADRRLFTVKVDGSDAVALTARPTSAGRETSMTGWTPEWSPDGKWIAIESFTAEMIDIIRADGGSPASLPSFRGAFPIWSPDGSEIACTDNEWIVIHPINGASRGVAADPYGQTATFPRWSPDRRRLLPHAGASTMPTELQSLDIARKTWSFIDADVLNAYWLP